MSLTSAISLHSLSSGLFDRDTFWARPLLTYKQDGHCNTLKSTRNGRVRVNDALSVLQLKNEGIWKKWGCYMQKQVFLVPKTFIHVLCETSLGLTGS